MSGVQKRPTKREILAAIKALREQNREVLRMVADRFPVGSKIDGCECKVAGVPYYDLDQVFIRIEYPMEAVRDGYPDFSHWSVETVLKRKRSR